MSYPEHPFISGLEDLTDEELQKRITELYTKLSLIYRGPNPNTYVIEQINMAINTYQSQYQARQNKRQADDTDGFNEIIDIS